MKTKRNDTAATMLAIAMGFLAIYLLFHWEWAAWVSLAVGLAGLLSPFLSEKIEWLWDKLGYMLSLIMPNVLLSIIYYLFLFPIATLSKLFGKKDPLVLKNRLESMYTASDKTFDKDSFENPW